MRTPSILITLGVIGLAVYAVVLSVAPAITCLVGSIVAADIWCAYLDTSL